VFLNRINEVAHPAAQSAAEVPGELEKLKYQRFLFWYWFSSKVRALFTKASRGNPLCSGLLEEGPVQRQGRRVYRVHAEDRRCVGPSLRSKMTYMPVNNLARIFSAMLASSRGVYSAPDDVHGSS
jgi:hypothetical protein